MRKVFLISPREPSGATWLINCLLELKIKTSRRSSLGMWAQKGNHHVLNEHEVILKKWLPALWDRQDFSFRNDVEVEWAHGWPTADHYNNQVIYFTRDPRDSLFSRYKREAPGQTFEEFIRFPDVSTLLDKAHNWRLFNLAWMQHPHHRLCRFEDYKQNDSEALAEILAFIGLSYPREDIEKAAAASTFSRAAEAEIKYRQAHPDDQELINRAGIAEEWKQGKIAPETLRYIETTCADAMRMQAYQCQDFVAQDTSYSNLVASLSFLRGLNLPAMARQPGGGDDMSEVAAKFAASVNYELLSRARLPQHELLRLLSSLTELAQAKNLEPRPDYKPLYEAFDLRTTMWALAMRQVRLFLGRTKRAVRRLLAQALRTI